MLSIANLPDAVTQGGVTLILHGTNLELSRAGAISSFLPKFVLFSHNALLDRDIKTIQPKDG